jgi:predicted dehydrogenase
MLGSIVVPTEGATMLHIGIIGYGGFGQFLHRAWHTLEKVNIIAVADVDPPELLDSDIQYYPDWRDLITSPAVDIVAVVTPPSTHSDIACAAMEAGKHVLIEKPIATRLSDAQLILEVRDRTKRVAGVDFMLRFHPLTQLIKMWCQSNSFGTLRRVVVENYAQDESLPPEHWFWKEDVSGGILVEHGVHFLDLVNDWAAVKVKDVQGLSFRRNLQQEDRALATIMYENGLIATHFHSFSRPGFFENTAIRAIFDLAEIQLEGWIPLGGRIRCLVNTQTEGELTELPNLVITHRTDIREAQDVSRPEGWGSRSDQDSSSQRVVRSGGIPYEISEMITGTFGMQKTKGEVYEDCLRDLLSDVTNAIMTPGYCLRVPLEHGIDSLKIALLASGTDGIAVSE